MMLPDLTGDPIAVEYLDNPRAWKGKLESGLGPGVEVHAGCFIRQRKIVLDSALLHKDAEHRRILVHELAHFVWVRLGRAERASWATLLQKELRSRARGELGWSAELAKSRLHPGDAVQVHRRFRRYLSESFCDTAAWLFAGIRSHNEFSLAKTYCSARRDWFAELICRRDAFHV